MTTTTDTLARDITDRLERRLAELAGLIGMDVIELYSGERARLVGEMLAAQLTDDAPRIAAQTAIDLAGLIDLDDPTDATSPLGVAVALTYEADGVTQSAASRMLGVSRQRVAELLAKGKLDRWGEDHVTRASIARRLAGR